MTQVNWSRGNNLIGLNLLDWNEPAISAEEPALEGPTPPGQDTLSHTMVRSTAETLVRTCMA